MAVKKTDLLSDSRLENIENSIEKLEKPKQDIANSLLKEAKFCIETLEKLKEKVNAEGVVTEMCQGEYSITRENPALKSYNTTIKNYQNIMKQLTDIFSTIPPDEKPDELKEWLDK